MGGAAVGSQEGEKAVRGCEAIVVMRLPPLMPFAAGERL